MKCADPKLCYTTSTGIRQLRHFSIANKLFILRAQQVFNCGTCLFCRKKKSYELASRCVLHASLYPRSCFLTLTYSESHPRYHNNFQYEDIQKFKKRLRKHCGSKKIEIYNVHEYGKNRKKHWHLIVFNHDFQDKKFYTQKNQNKLYTSIKLSELWSFGFSTIGDVSEASAMYQSQYTQKDTKNNNLGTKYKSHSKHSGIGRPYFLKHYKQILELGYIPFGGKKMPLPRYFEKLAHKHYSHYYETSNFFDLPYRKKLYTPFKIGEENKEIADLYIQYKTIKEEKIKELTEEWENVIQSYLDTNEKPDFIKSAENALYDLKNKNDEQIF